MARRDAYTALMDGLLQIEDCLDADGGIVLPPGVTLISLIDRNIANVGDSVAYRYLDFTRSDAGQPTEITWTQLGIRMRAIGARVQQVTARGDRVAVLAPQGLDYIAGFFAAVKAGTIAVPLFAPELPGHVERLETALNDAQPTAVLTTNPVRDAVEAFLATIPPARRPHVIVIDEIPDSAAEAFTPVATRRRRRFSPAVHVGCDAAPCRRRGHPPGSRHQPFADDPLDRPVGPKHPRRQLVTALPRHGLVYGRLSSGVRRALDTDGAHRIHPQAAAVDSCVVGRIPQRPRRHRRAELRL